MELTRLVALLAAPWRWAARALGLGRSGERWLGYLAGLAGVAVASVAIGLVLGRARLANVSMLYLIAIMLTAVTFGRGPAVVASLAAFLTFDYFFVAPFHTFAVADPEEWVALLLFLLTGAVTSALAAGQRARAAEAEQREREAVVLYDVVRLIAGQDFELALRQVAYRVEGASKRARGLGIGLAIARGLVEAHGGRIRAENRPGGGARFTIELPLEAEAPGLRSAT